MHVVALKKVVQTGVHRATNNTVTDIPEDIGQAWVKADFARPATKAEAETGKVSVEEPKLKK